MVELVLVLKITFIDKDTEEPLCPRDNYIYLEGVDGVYGIVREDGTCDIYTTFPTPKGDIDFNLILRGFFKDSDEYAQDVYTSLTYYDEDNLEPDEGIDTVGYYFMGYNDSYKVNTLDDGTLTCTIPVDIGGGKTRNTIVLTGNVGYDGETVIVPVDELNDLYLSLTEIISGTRYDFQEPEVPLTYLQYLPIGQYKLSLSGTYKGIPNVETSITIEFTNYRVSEQGVLTFPIITDNYENPDTEDYIFIEYIEDTTGN